MNTYQSVIYTIRQSIRRMFFWFGILFMVCWMVFPFYWMVNSALKGEVQIQMTPGTLVPRNPNTHAIDLTLKNFHAVFQNIEFRRGLVNSLIVAGVTTGISLLLGSFAAFALGKLRFPGKHSLQNLILAMTVFPQIGVLAGLYALINRLNIPARPSMIVSYMLFILPFTVWLQTSFFKSLPLSLLHAAYVDGASPFQTFYLILLPLTAPAVVTTGLLAFIGAWNEYLFALTFTSIEPEAKTVTVAVAQFAGKFAHHEPFGEIMAAGVVVTVPLIILVLIFQKKIIAGLTAGAVKG